MGMSPDAITPGISVMVRHDRHWPCGHHRIAEVPLFQNVGVVDGFDNRRGEHRVVVVFRGIHSPVFGEPWVEADSANALGSSSGSIGDREPRGRAPLNRLPIGAASVHAS